MCEICSKVVIKLPERRQQLQPRKKLMRQNWTRAKHFESYFCVILAVMTELFSHEERLGNKLFHHPI